MNQIITDLKSKVLIKHVASLVHETLCAKYKRLADEKEKNAR